MNTPWTTYNHPLVRSLAWALTSPALVDGLSGKLPCCDQQQRASLANLDQNPAPLCEHLANDNSHRLGSHFEALWQFYFLHHPDYQLLAHNLQVRDTSKRTLGAFDFIYRHLPSGKTHHLEVAVKFYLFTGASHQVGEQQRWPGPNPADNLATKVGRLINHQLPLNASPEGLETLAKLGVDAVDSSAAALKGYLFYPWQQQLPLPEWAPENHCRGSWLTAAKTNELIEHFPKSNWCVLEKRQWLGEESDVPSDTVFGKKELAELATGRASQYPVMVARLATVDGALREVERFFIVPDDWPLPR